MAVVEFFDGGYVSAATLIVVLQLTPTLDSRLLFAVTTAPVDAPSSTLLMLIVNIDWDFCMRVLQYPSISYCTCGSIVVIIDCIADC